MSLDTWNIDKRSKLFQRSRQQKQRKIRTPDRIESSTDVITSMKTTHRRSSQKLNNKREEEDMTSNEQNVGNNLTEDKLSRINKSDTADETSASAAINPTYIMTVAEVEIPADVVEVRLHGGSISRIENLDSFTNLRSVDLSCNRLVVMEGLKSLVRLRELKLYGNKIKRLDGLHACKALEALYLQHNKIVDMNPICLKDLRQLNTLRLDNNSLTIMSGLTSTHSNLAHFDISHNNIKKLNIEDLNGLKHIDTLKCSSNYLENIDFIDSVPGNSLKELDMSYNSLKSLNGLKSCSNLSILRITSNGLTSLSSLPRLRFLTELHASHNKFTSLKGIVFARLLPLLEILDLSHNSLADPDDVITAVSGLRSLTECYVTANPAWSVTGRCGESLEVKLLTILTGLEILDGRRVTRANSGGVATLMRPNSSMGLVRPSSASGQRPMSPIKSDSNYSRPLMRPASSTTHVTSAFVEEQLNSMTNSIADLLKSLSTSFIAIRESLADFTVDEQTEHNIDIKATMLQRRVGSISHLLAAKHYSDDTGNVNEN